MNAKIRSLDGQSVVPLVITEINGRPLNLFFKEGETWERLSGMNRDPNKDLSILLQPADIVSKFKKQLKSVRSYKDFLLGWCFKDTKYKMELLGRVIYNSLSTVVIEPPKKAFTSWFICYYFKTYKSIGSILCKYFFDKIVLAIHSALTFQFIQQHALIQPFILMIPSESNIYSNKIVIIIIHCFHSTKETFLHLSIFIHFILFN